MTLQCKKTLLILVGSPRRNGNSALLAKAVQEGGEAAGYEIKYRFIDDYMTSFLKDCRTCRDEHGECSIQDAYKGLFLDDYLTADGVIFCSPVYWYGLSAQMKAFFDRTFCYYSASYYKSSEVIKNMSGKRIGLVLSSEETYPGASLGIIHQIQEFSRYTHSEFIDVVRGIGNSRGEVTKDPNRPLAEAELLGKEILSKKFSDYRLDSLRSGKVWE